MSGVESYKVSDVFLIESKEEEAETTIIGSPPPREINE